MSSFFTVRYSSGKVTLLDQTRLPGEEVYVELGTVEDVARAIETLVVRGAPAIGVTAAFGMALAARTGHPLNEAHERLARTRPTAVNLFWALSRMKSKWSLGVEALEREAQLIYDEDAEACRKIGELGQGLIPDGATVLTHCNAGALATSEHGTALSVIRAAHRAGKKIRVFADETRPVLQGARLTAWELMKDGIDVTIIPDGAVAHFLGRGVLDCAVVGADRIARNGDFANKIGTRGVACLFRAHDRMLYCAAPWSTVDLALASGDEIPIEERSPDEVTTLAGVRVAPVGAKARNPAFDVTPAGWIGGIVTERGFTGKDVAAGLARLAEVE
ncbi:MAG: S-methyl-5-thioribose-1-phosphate isomerase [Deltaproteobacteria bacterium]|nr:S-methyl-5-thioribose-1-phosphate isomerase [Deltaproteobacteria bacterium]